MADHIGIVKCPKCGFEQIEASPDECLKCGILFEKWQNRMEQSEEDVDPVEDVPYLAEQLQAGLHSSQQVSAEAGPMVILGGTLCQIGVWMAAFAVLSFAINLVGFEFMVLLPLEVFDDPTRAKLWMLGIGIAMAVVGAGLGGDFSDDD